MADETFYQPISNILEVEALPDQLDFIKDGVSNLLNTIYYRNLQFTKNARGDAAFYSLNIISRERIDIEIPGTGMFLVLHFIWYIICRFSSEWLVLMLVIAILPLLGQTLNSHLSIES